jgi:hypothetical protein
MEIAPPALLLPALLLAVVMVEVTAPPPEGQVKKNTRLIKVWKKNGPEGQVTWQEMIERVFQER